MRARTRPTEVLLCDDDTKARVRQLRAEGQRRRDQLRARSGKEQQEADCIPAPLNLTIQIGKARDQEQRQLQALVEIRRNEAKVRLEHVRARTARKAEASSVDGSHELRAVLVWPDTTSRYRIPRTPMVTPHTPSMPNPNMKNFLQVHLQYAYIFKPWARRGQGIFGLPALLNNA